MLATWCALLLTQAAVPAASGPDGLLLYAPFDGSPDAVLAAGSAANLGAGGLSFTDGLRGRAVVLGGDCRFRRPGNLRLEQGTLAVWVRPHWPGTDPAPHYVFCFWGAPDQPDAWEANRYNLNFEGGDLVFTIFTRDLNKRPSVVASVRNWLPEEWHHVAVTWAGVNSGRPDGQMALYLDGKPAGTLPPTEISVGPTEDVMDLGRDQDANPRRAQADFEDLFIYDHPLSPQEIASAVKAIRQGAPSEAPAPGGARPPAEGWWNATYPFRCHVPVPAGTGQGTVLECPLRVGADLAALGVPGTPNLASLELVDDTGLPLPRTVEEGLVAWRPTGAQSYWLYFGADRYEITAPLLGTRRLFPAPTPVPPFTGVTWPDYATEAYGKPWDFKDGTFSGIDAWGDKPQYVRNKKVVNGILTLDVSTDPYFIWGTMWGPVDQNRRKVSIDLARFPVLEMRIRQSVERAMWRIFGRVQGSDRLWSYEFPVTGTGWQLIHVDLLKDARWRGVISAFRVNPTWQVDAHVEIDWVSLRAVTMLQAQALEALGEPTGAAARVALSVPQTRAVAGSAQEVTVTVTDAAGKPVAGQPVAVWMREGSGGTLADSPGQPSLALGPQGRRGLTDDAGKLTVRYQASRRAAEAADRLLARAEFTRALPAEAVVDAVPGPPHHYRVEPTAVVTLDPKTPSLPVSAQLVDQFGNPAGKVRPLRWETEEGGMVTTVAADAATFGGKEARRWVYHVRVHDDQGLSGESAAICLLPGQPRKDPIVIGPNGYFRKGADGPAWLPLGGFYANWVGLPENGEEGRRLISFVDATDEQLDHWMSFLASQGVTAMRFMLRAHTPQGMEPMDVIGRVNLPLFARVLHYMDLARKYNLRFLLTIHEDYTKPAYYDEHALETFCLPRYAGEDLDKLPPYQRRFVRDRKLIGDIGEKYTDPDVMACQDQYTRQLVRLLKDNPQLFGWELENEMVDCPQSWANHMVGVIRSEDPVTPICASHGGGGLNTADPLWWRTRTAIDFYTYHLYAYPGSTLPDLDYGAAVDVLATYGRMVGRCMLGESSGDEFSSYPPERDADRRFIMRDIIWLSLVNGNPGCFFWNSRGAELQQFRLANKVASALDWREWVPEPGQVGLVVAHPLDDDKYYRTPRGDAEYAVMGRYAQDSLSRGVSLDYTPDGRGYATVAGLGAFQAPAAAPRVSVGPGWQVRVNARRGLGQGLAYVRNFAGVWHWELAGRANMYLRIRKAAPLTVRLNLPAQRLTLTVTDLDTGQERRFEVTGQGQADLGVTDHDFALTWCSVAP